MRRTTRLVAWVVILVLAALQTYAWRHSMSPDGMSYLDLSDAVTTGEWARLVNLYWSPLYPLLIGIARVVLRPGAYWEFGTVHLVTLLSFIATFVAFEYFLKILLALASVWRRSPLATPLGVASCYVIFGAFALTMTPMELTTPDLLVAAASLIALGALLRATQDHARLPRLALVLGASLGIGALAKSFLVPWSIVCLVVFAIATRRHGIGPIARAAVVWCVFVVPWTIILSRAAGRFTFGDAGRLTFAWYVNGQDVPSLGGVPPGTRTPAVQSILPGAGVTGDAPGTDPMWFDPARWNASVVPHWSTRDEVETVWALVKFYIQNLTPLFFAFTLIAVGVPGTRRLAWWRGWAVFVPVLAGLAAYASVIVTTRYIMAFLLAGTLALVAALPWPRRVLPRMLLLGVMLPLALEAFAPNAAVPLALMAAMIAGMIAGGAMPTRSRAGWVVVVVLVAVIARLLLPPPLRGLVQGGAILLAIALWLLARAAVRARRTVRFSLHAGGALALLLVLVIVFRAVVRLKGDFDALERHPGRGSANISWELARDLSTYGIIPGTRIALVGPADQAYWARAGRLHIVADVPTPRVKAFWDLSRAAQDELLAQFAAAGATYAVASIGPARPADSSWTRTRYGGYVRRIAK